MGKLRELLSIKTTSGDPVKLNDYTLTPQSQTVILGGSTRGIIWNRPLAVVVEQDGTIKRLPVIDLTRLIQVGLLLTGVIGTIFGMITLIKIKDK